MKDTGILKIHIIYIVRNICTKHSDCNVTGVTLHIMFHLKRCPRSCGASLPYSWYTLIA